MVGRSQAKLSCQDTQDAQTLRNKHGHFSLPNKHRSCHFPALISTHLTRGLGTRSSEIVVTTLTPEAARVWAAVRSCQLRVRLLRGWEERHMMTTSTHRKWYFPKNYHNFDVSGGYFEHVGPLTTFQHHLIQHFTSGFGQARTLSTFRYSTLCKRKALNSD